MIRAWAFPACPLCPQFGPSDRHLSTLPSFGKLGSAVCNGNYLTTTSSITVKGVGCVLEPAGSRLGTRPPARRVRRALSLAAAVVHVS